MATSAELITGTTAWQGSLSSYDSQGNLSASTDGRGVTVSADGSSVTANAQATQYTAHQLYNAQGDQTAAGTPPITTTLNGVPNVNTAVTSTTGYDSDGNPTSSTTPNGNSTTMAYDHLGRQTSTTLPPVTLSTGQVVQPVQSTIYDGEDHLVRATDANNNSTLLSYDPLGRLVSSVNPVSGTTTNTYNATELIATQDPVGNTSHYQYDAAGRLTQVTDPLTGTALYQYDPAGNTTVITGGDTSGGVTQVQTQQYDSRNQVISATVTGPDGATAATQMGYDQDGNTTYQQAPNGDVTLSTYDRADRALSVQLVPTGGSTSGPQETYSYDASGNMTRAVDMDGRVSSMAYDGDARLTQGVDVVTAPTGTTTITTTPGYDPNGNALSQTTLTADSASPGVVTTHSQSATYNAADWIPSSSDDGLTTGYGYDAAGQQRSQSTSGSVGTVSQAFALDPQGRATAIGEGVAPYTSTFGYNANDAVITATLPGSLGAVQQSATYDANQRVRTVSAQGYATGVLTTTLDNSYSYGYTPVGWTSGVTYVVNGVQSVQVITHNALGRVTAQSGYGDAPRGGAEQWSYDPSGNITQTLEPMAGSTQNVTTTDTYDPAAPNELQSQHTVGLGTASFGYDQQGNTTAISSTDPLTSQYAISTTLKYDAQGRPLTVTVLEQDPCAPRTPTSFLTSAVVFGYNAAGQRASYTVIPPAGCAPLSYSARYRYDGGGLLSEAAIISGTTTGTTSYTDTYLYDQGGNPLELVRARAGGSTDRYWYALDGRGNVVALTDATGAAVDRYRYDIWGEPSQVIEAATARQQLRYAGYWYDAKLGWYWLSVRSYEPEGRFLQPDPSMIEGTRSYVYVGDDPIDVTDPSGLWGCPSGLTVCTPPSSVGATPVAGATTVQANGSRGVSLPSITCSTPVLGGLRPSCLHWPSKQEVMRRAQARQRLLEKIAGGSYVVGAIFLYRINSKSNRMGARYQRFVTGKDYSEMWQLADGSRVEVDAINSMIVEVKYTNGTSAAFSGNKPSPYSPQSRFYNEEKIVEQMGNQIRLAQEKGLPGLRYTVSNDAARLHFENLLRARYPEQFASGFVRIYEVPVTGIPGIAAPEPER